MFFDQVFRPKLFAALSVQTKKDQDLVEDIDLAATHGGRRARPISTFIVGCAGIPTAIIDPDADGHSPDFLACRGIECDTDFPIRALEVPIHLGKRLTLCDSKGTKAVLYRCFPKHLWTAGRPIQIRGLGANAVSVGSAIFRPVSGAQPHRTYTEHANE